MSELNNQTPASITSFSLEEVSLVIKKSWYWVLLLLVIGFCVSFAYLRWTAPRFNSSSVLKLEVKSQSGVVGINLPQTQGMDNYGDLVGEVEFIKSNLIYDGVIDKLNLQISYHQKGKFMDEEKYNLSPFQVAHQRKTNVIFDKPIFVKFIEDQKVQYGIENSNGDIDFKTSLVRDSLSIGGFNFLLSKTDYYSGQNQDVLYYFIVHSYPSLKNFFNKNLNVQILNVNAKTIKIDFEHFNARKASDIVNAIDTVYLHKTLEKKQKVQEQTIAFIVEQLDSAEKKLSNAETNIESFVRSVKTIDPSSEFAITLDKIDELRQLSKVSDRQLFYLKDLKQQIASGTPLSGLSSIASIIESSALSLVIQQLNTKNEDLAKLRLTYSESTMVYKKMKTEVDALKSNLSEILNQEIALLESESIKIARDVAELQERFYSLPSKETEMNRLKRFYNLYERFYLSLQSKKVEYGIAKAGTVPEFVILSQASPSSIPISPKKTQIYAAGILFGFVSGILLLVIRLLSQNTIVSESELKSKLQMPLLGLVPKYTKGTLEFSKLVIDNNSKSSISESFRSIRTNVEFLCSLSEKRVFGITSTTSGEGKTFITANLAGVISSAGKRVIVLDLDMRKPKVHIAFDSENKEGLSNILAEKVEFKDCIQKTKLEGLDFISAGTIPPNPTELMLRPSFDKLIKDLKEYYDLVLIDTPPVGIVTDGNLVLRKADLAIFVMRAGYTKKGSETLVNTMYASSQFNEIGVVLNAVHQLGGYGYGYGYGYYDEEDSGKLSFFKRLFFNRDSK